ncbi:MAG TPA: type I-E CRISPR-associated protein Cas5/CasD [Ktedonobacterales bacterium]|nr:type I-E CRISPR-associated protein Cas5/CasD [Ktedonobacterales bacterium]
MSTLLIRLEGPMQSWGIQSQFARRDTSLEPSKSGVIGLLCAALGRPRSADLSDLAALRMGVRVDRQGTVRSDYHTAGGTNRTNRIGRTDTSNYGVAAFDGSKPGTVLSTRFYLADASFLVGLEAATPVQEHLLEQLDVALARPVWPLFLGRKAFVPSLPVRLPDVPPIGPGLQASGLEKALSDYPWPEARAGEIVRKPPSQLRLVIEEDIPMTGESRMDVPVSFLPLDRRYQSRYVRTEFMHRPPSATTVVDPEIAAEE